MTFAASITCRSAGRGTPVAHLAMAVRQLRPRSGLMPATTDGTSAEAAVRRYNKQRPVYKELGTCPFSNRLEHRQMIAMKLFNTIVAQRLQPALGYCAANLQFQGSFAQQQEFGT